MNHRQQLFVEAYKRTKNCSESAKIAGYSARSAYNHGRRLMQKDEIRKEIEEAIALEKAKISKEKYCALAIGEYESSELKSDRIRALELSGKALGFIGSGNAGPVTNNVLIDARSINVEGLEAPKKLDEMRKLIE